jgi:hypothetical protein
MKATKMWASIRSSLLMVDREDRQAPFECFECLFNLNELDIELPHLFGITIQQVRSQQIATFTAANVAQLVFAQREG